MCLMLKLNNIFCVSKHQSVSCVLIFGGGATHLFTFGAQNVQRLVLNYDAYSYCIFISVLFTILKK